MDSHTTMEHSLALPGHISPGAQRHQNINEQLQGSAGNMHRGNPMLRASPEPTSGKRTEFANVDTTAAGKALTPRGTIVGGPVPSGEDPYRRQRRIAAASTANQSHAALSHQIPIELSDAGVIASRPHTAAAAAATAGAGAGATATAADDVSSTRLAAAFAKRDYGRQGKLAPTEFAAAVRSLGVPLSTPIMPGAQHAASSNLSSDTVDYLSFMASLEPPTHGINTLSSAASTAVAAAAAASACDPAPGRGGPAASAAGGGVHRKKSFGVHAHTHRSQVQLGTGTGAGGGGGGEAAWSAQAGVAGGDGRVGALHQHAAFASAAGRPVEQPEAHRRRPPADAAPVAHHHTSIVMPRGDDPFDVSDMYECLDAASLPPAAAAGVASAVGDETWGQAGQGKKGALHAVMPHVLSSADRVIFGHVAVSVPGVEAGGGDSALAAIPARLQPHLAASVDEIVFGRDTDGSREQPALTANAKFEGAAGVHSSSAPLDLGAAAPPAPLLPHNRATADSIVFGRDLDGSDACGVRAELASHRADGAAGQWAPRAAVGEAGCVPIRRSREYLDDLNQPTATVASVLSGWGDSDQACGVRSVRRGVAAAPSNRRYVASERAHIGPPPHPSPVVPVASMMRQTLSSAARSREPPTPRESATPATTPTATPMSARPTSSAAPATGTSSSSLAAPAAGVRVLHLSQPPPRPPDRAPGAFVARTLEGVAVTMSTAGAAATSNSALGPPSAWASDKFAAGRPSERNPSGFRNAEPRQAAGAAGRPHCALSASERKWGGQLSVTGGLG